MTVHCSSAGGEGWRWSAFNFRFSCCILLQQTEITVPRADNMHVAGSSTRSESVRGHGISNLVCKVLIRRKESVAMPGMHCGNESVACETTC